MKKLTSIVVWLSAFLVIGGISIFQEYFAEHKYYFDMLADGKNWGMMVMGIICALIPLGYQSLFDKPSTKGFLYSSGVAMLIFAYSFIAIRDDMVGGAFIMLPLNISLMIGGTTLMIGGMWSGGSMLYRILYRQEADTLDRAIVALILGFVGALCISWVVVMATLLYQIVTIGCLILCGRLIYKEQQFLRKLALNIGQLIQNNLGFTNWSKSLTSILFVITLMYLMYGVMSAFIPYPTAWDANHAYMYFPKVWAEHHGYLWNSMSAQFSPSPWLTYVAVWFQFGYTFKSVGGWIWPDTWAVMMNYLTSVPVVMIMIWGLIRRVISYANLRNKPILYHSAWMIILSWFTSGMGAFLVFVDNKSDFGILAITLCSLVLLFEWLPRDGEEESNAGSPFQLNSLLLSGFAAGVAVFSKPTSLFDFASIFVLFAGVVAGAWAMIGSGLLVIGAMALMKITTVPLYLSMEAGKLCVIAGLIIIIVSVFAASKKKIVLWSRLLIWGAVMIGLLVLTKTPLMLWRQHSLGSEIGGAKGYIQGILMGHVVPHHESIDKTRNTSPQHLLAQNSSSIGARSCTLQSEGITKETLYDGTQKATTEGAGEDLGRYIGYGGKTWDMPWWRFILSDGSCVGFDHDARVLCQARIDISEGKFTSIENKLQGDALDLFEAALKQKDQGVSASYIQKNLARQLTLYRQDKIILKSDNKVTIPYRWLTPLNITYNWSLQNLSSYYTDIGVVRLILLVIVCTATVWMLIYHPRRALIPMTTLIAWSIRWVSGSAIMWYGIGLIIWTLMSVIVIVDTWTSRDTIDEQSIIWVEYVVMSLVGVIMCIQLLLNFIRIGSQGGGGIFVQYKTSNAKITTVTEQLQVEESVKYAVSGKDIFDMQFPHYNKTIKAIDAQSNQKSATLIAGTYMPYFILNQYNIISDGFLSIMWEWFSDQNICRSYLRLKDKNLTYLVIDPNIASVVMGEGNSTLRDRMFAKIDPVTNKIVEHGAVSMLASLVSSGYIELFNTNNIAAKYAFTLSDADMMSVFGVASGDLPLLRTKVATARFWGEEGNTLLQQVLQIMSQRMVTDAGIGDIADIVGKDVDVPKLAAMVKRISTPDALNAIKELNQDERYVLLNYMSLLSAAKSNPQGFQQSLVGLLQQSIGGGSQLIVFKVK